MNTQKFIRRWEKYRKKDQGKYALINGTILSISKGGKKSETKSFSR